MTVVVESVPKHPQYPQLYPMTDPLHVVVQLFCGYGLLESMPSCTVRKMDTKRVYRLMRSNKQNGSNLPRFDGYVWDFSQIQN